MKTFVVGNWKMNFTTGEASIYLHKIQRKFKPTRGLEVVVAPSTVALQPLSLQLEKQKSKIKLATQNIATTDYGPYTGETSANQLRGIVKYAIIGHSERRYLYNETDKIIKQKVSSALRSNITPIICIGETASERDYHETADIIRDQLLSALSDVAREDLKKVIIAYEPVWAISTSSKNAKLATPDDIAPVIDLIRRELKILAGADLAQEIPILYGGSVSPDNAGAYLTIPGINGLLIGNSSLILSQFLDIIEIAKRVK
ncbi:triose-phosphate isomerase [Candidatus Saccharibacteria bacterium]|nr:triose-phosphate isomerase [Candidatus Saccharibacteria bacterium]MBR2709736.1 triose-phosphate isomerase [Candidatus Saccharibacteria bacterium]